MSHSRYMKHWALGLMTLAVGCGPVDEPQDTSVQVEAITQVEQATTTTTTYTLSWPDNTATGDCRFGDTSLGHQAATNTRASGRLEESLSLSGLAGRRISSIRLNGSANTFKYDDVMLLAYNNHLVMSSDTRVAQYSANTLSLGTSPVSYVWSNILNDLIDNQNIQSPWCTSGATTCSVPRTETYGTMDINVPSFSSVDLAAYPSAPSTRTFKLVTIGDNDTSIDCRHGPVSLSVTVTHEPATCANTPSQCGSEFIPGDSCAHIKTTNAAAGDGVYWVKTTTGKTRVYCDMQLSGGTELCRDGVVKEVTGRTREGSNLSYRMSTVLRPSTNTCEMWAIRAVSDGAPLDRVATLPLSTCQALGFKADAQLGTCYYGHNMSDCGFISTPYYRYGNHCTGCTLNEGGPYPTYVKQGYMYNATILSNVSGTIRTHCSTL